MRNLRIFLLVAVVAAVAIFAQSSLAAKKTCEATYDNFGKTFMEKYCNKCHVSTKTGAMARMGAPAGYDFDKVESIEKYKDKIVKYTTVKKSMPPTAPKPTDDENAKLTLWLGCEYAK